MAFTDAACERLAIRFYEGDTAVGSALAGTGQDSARSTRPSVSHDANGAHLPAVCAPRNEGGKLYHRRMASSRNDCACSPEGIRRRARLSSGPMDTTDCPGLAISGVGASCRAKRGNVLDRHRMRARTRRVSAAGVVTLVLVFGGLVLSPAAVSEETNAPAPADTADRDTATADSAPFSGNLELKSRLDATGKVTVAGERLHAWLLRRFYAAHGYQTVWDGHPAEASRLLQEAVLRAADHGLDPGLFHSTALTERASTL